MKLQKASKKLQVKAKNDSFGPYTMRREARVEALSATKVEGAAAGGGGCTLDTDGTESPGTTALSATSGTAFDVTGNSDSSAT